MKTVRALLNEKGFQVWACSPDTPIFEALELMAEKDIGALIVLQDGMLAGILSERDYARKVILKGKASKNTPVKEIMTPEVITVRLQQTVAECQAIMGRYRIRHLPVLDGKKVVGIISIGDVVQVMLAEQEEALRRMEQFALGDSLTE